MAETTDSGRSKKPKRRALDLSWPLEKLGIKKPPAKEIDDDFLKTAAERAYEAYEADRVNIEAAYEDLEFLAGNQWPDYARQQREHEQRPMLTFNRLPQFVQQVTGDIDLQKPATKIVPIDGRATEEVAQVLKGMIRYIKNRSEAEVAYGIAGDQAVACGIGHMQVSKEYAEGTTYNQECRIGQIDDGVSVLWDPNAKLPTKEDGEYCFVPYDMSHSAFKAKYPDVPMSDFNSYDARYTTYWYGTNFVRVAVYWEKRPFKRTLALHKDGTVEDLSDDTPAEIAKAKARGAQIRKRDGFKVFRSVITLGNTLEEPEEWPGMFIPVVPIIGKEVRIGRRTVRYGLVRFAKDAQTSYNFARTTQTEIYALQPKAPYVATQKNVEEFEDMWSTANTKNWPTLLYTPDPLNGGAAPQRVAPPVGSSAVGEAAALADQDMKGTTGIYDASLGNRSNETSGVAIKAREAQGDIGTVRYIKNFMLAERQIDRVLLDLIPHVYDTERIVQVLGDDGKLQNVTINKAVAAPELADEAEEPIDLGDEEPEEIASEEQPEEIEDDTDEAVDEADEDEEFAGAPTDEEEDAFGEPKRYINDVTIGAYGVVVENGPSYATKRDEAREGMQQFIQAAPDVAPAILDLYAKAQDWPMAQEIGERLEAILPPPIQAAIAKEKAKKEGQMNGGAGPPQTQGLGPGGPVPPGMPGPPGMPPGLPPPPPPNPAEIAKVQSDTVIAQSKAHVAELDVQIKNIELQIKQIELAAKSGQGGDPNVINGLVEEVAHLHGMVAEVVSMMGGKPEEQTPQGVQNVQ